MKVTLLILSFICAPFNPPKSDALAKKVLLQDQDIHGSFSFKRNTRSYIIHLPTSFYQNKDQKFPLVIALHGGGGSADDMMRLTGLNEKADNANFIVVYPEGLRNPSRLRTWNAGRCCGANASFFNVDDVGFISALIDTMVARYHVDGKRVYATGHSNGAMLCYRLANELSNKIAAIAPNSGSFQFYGTYSPWRNVPVIHIHSKKDSNVKYLGGKSDGITGVYSQPVDDFLNVVASKAGCKSSKKTVATYPLYTIYEWTNCDDPNFKVLLYLTNDGGHSWPGGKRRFRLRGDQSSQAFDNDDIIWDFFKQFSLP